MKTYSLYFLTLGMLLTLFSCINCDKEITCPPFPTELEQYLPYNEGDEIEFKNDDGVEISFTINEKYYSHTNTLECRKTGLGCQCPTLFLDCQPNAQYNGTSVNGERIIYDSIRNTTYNYNYLEYSIRTRLNNSDGVKSIAFKLIDARGTFQYLPEIVLNEGQVYLREFQAGNTTYKNVILHRKNIELNDQNDPPFDTDFISEIYIQPEIGIIAFYDLQTNSLFSIQ